MSINTIGFHHYYKYVLHTKWGLPVFHYRLYLYICIFVFLLSRWW